MESEEAYKRILSMNDSMKLSLFKLEVVLKSGSITDKDKDFIKKLMLPVLKLTNSIDRLFESFYSVRAANHETHLPIDDYQQFVDWFDSEASFYIKKYYKD